MDRDQRYEALRKILDDEYWEFRNHEWPSDDRLDACSEIRIRHPELGDPDDEEIEVALEAWIADNGGVRPEPEPS